MSKITGNDIQNMVTHWIHTPENGYLGSGYGQNLKSILQKPMMDSAADEQLKKMRDDVAIVNLLPEQSANIYSLQTDPDRLDLIIEVGGTAFEVPEQS